MITAGGDRVVIAVVRVVTEAPVDILVGRSFPTSADLALPDGGAMMAERNLFHLF